MQSLSDGPVLVVTMLLSSQVARFDKMNERRFATTAPQANPNPTR